MDSECRLRECVEQLGKRNNIAGLALEPNGCAGIEVSDGRRVYVKLDREQDRVVVYRALLPLQAADLGVLQRSMELNLLGAGTGGGVLSTSRHMEAIVYHTSVAAPLVDVTWLEGALEEVLANGGRLAELLVQGA
jgi:Tir chaperone protein (CesT) family